MASDEWRQCAEWLVRCRILPDDHKATHSDASAFDLAQTLRDGVLICHLLNNLVPGAVDSKDFSPRPQLSQFICIKNIRAFLQSCKTKFGLKDADLFDPPDLFDVKDFRRVIQTLSKLSKTPLAQSKVSGFPDQAPPRPPRRTVTDDEEDIYGNLPDLALDHDLDDNEEIYDKVYQDDDDEIYEDLMSTRRNKRESRVSELPPPVTKRDHCVKELHDTEKNYVDALDMLQTHFIRPSRDAIPHADRDIIFAHIEKLLEVHKSFQSELQQACIYGQPPIGDTFVKYKKKLLLYGDYCSNMPHAQERLEEVTKKSETIRQHIESCEKKANDGKFRLRDLLHVPMQRVLKYHLLLRELIKSTDKNANDRDSLERGLEAMMDLSLYVNEVKRDNETLQLIAEIQNSISDLEMPAKTSLKDYGRLQKDGELRVKNHSDNKMRIRYIFLFDKVMLMCKARGETYSFKEAIILAMYKVHDQATVKDAQKRGDKWSSSFIMAKKDDRNAYTFYAKTEDMKNKWVEAVRLALENTSPPAGQNYVMHTFDQPTECCVCKKLLRGVFFQGYLCQQDGQRQALHKECIGKSPSDNNSKVRALVDYTGTPRPSAGRPPLEFHKEDVITLLNNDSEWWQGTLNGHEGWFPSQLVQEEHARSRKDTVNLDNDGMSSHLNGYKWFVGPMDRDTAVGRLLGVPNGTFLIRVSENPGRRGELSLSIKYDNQVRHIRVEKNVEGLFYLADTKFFSSLPDLVTFYQDNSLADSFPGVDTTLKFPFKSQTSSASKILGYATAVYDYAATATTQLSLCRGDRVAILSKTGSDKGWWKGEHCITEKIGYFPLAYVKEDDDD
ncbi:hypothetical protein FSP39_013478 [Pinctada imbricata]|uniref:Uncharacterized protein n=1 Tax=Pinctada imbricata TaxID=66713 RepID=A0AA88XM82_PINIB|nr:hypothetical protein FSP39_013478 [Pinctada imbricata]